MRFIFAAFVALSSWQASAQGGFFYTVFVRSGPNLAKLLIEKRADLTIGIIAGNLVLAEDKLISPLFAEKSAAEGDLKNCTGLTGKIATCAGDVRVGKEVPLPDKTLKDVTATVTGSMLTTDLSPLKTLNLSGIGNGKFPSRVDETWLKVQPPTASATPPTAPTTTGQAPQVKSVAARMAEMTYWFSIQNSAFIPDFEDYLHRYPDGEFRTLAENRLVFLKAQPQPLPRAAPLACAESEEAILAPVRFLYRAINNRDMNAYMQPWTQRATYRTYSNLVRMDKQQLFEDRGRAFSRWSEVYLDLVSHRILFDGPLGTATVRGYYVVDYRQLDGSMSHDQAVESYSLVCEPDGLWRIAETVLYD